MSRGVIVTPGQPTIGVCHITMYPDKPRQPTVREPRVPTKKDKR